MAKKNHTPRFLIVNKWTISQKWTDRDFQRHGGFAMYYYVDYSYLDEDCCGGFSDDIVCLPDEEHNIANAIIMLLESKHHGCRIRLSSYREATEWEVLNAELEQESEKERREEFFRKLGEEIDRERKEEEKRQTRNFYVISFVIILSIIILFGIFWSR